VRPIFEGATILVRVDLQLEDAGFLRIVLQIQPVSHRILSKGHWDGRTPLEDTSAASVGIGVIEAAIQEEGICQIT